MGILLHHSPLLGSFVNAGSEHNKAGDKLESYSYPSQKMRHKIPERDIFLEYFIQSPDLFLEKLNYYFSDTDDLIRSDQAFLCKSLKYPQRKVSIFKYKINFFSYFQ